MIIVCMCRMCIMPYNSYCAYGSILDIASSKQHTHTQTHNTLSHIRTHTPQAPLQINGTR